MLIKILYHVHILCLLRKYIGRLDMKKVVCSYIFEVKIRILTKFPAIKIPLMKHPVTVYSSQTLVG